MSQTAQYLLAKYWPFGLALLGLLCLVYLITAIGMFVSSRRRNAHLMEQNEILRYQNELLKWVGTQIKEHPPGG